MDKIKKYLPYFGLFLVFILFRITNTALSDGISDVELKTLGVIHSSFPFGYIKETVVGIDFFPFYTNLIYLFEIIFKNELLLRAINALISFATIIFAFNFGKKLQGLKMGLFVGLIFSINHFFLYYSNLIAPYCLMFLIGTILINFIYDYINKPDKKNLRKLLTANLLFIFTDKTAIIYVLSEILVLMYGKVPKKVIKKAIPAFLLCFFVGIFLTMPNWLCQYFVKLNIVFPDLTGKIAFNFNGLYLTLNEYISPYLSFSSSESSTKSTLGMLYSFFLNPDLRNINSLKIFLTLLYSSLLPIGFGMYLCYKSYSKNFKLSILARIALLNFVILLIFSIFRLCDLRPIYITQFFITFIILFAYGISLIKDKFVKYLFIVCFILIQVINPKINSFNIVIDKKYPTVNVINTFLAEYPTAKNALYIAPYQGKYVKSYFNKLDIADFDNSKLFTKQKNGFFDYLASLNSTKPSKKNSVSLYQSYLEKNKTDTYILDYLNNYVLSKDNKTLIVFVDKFNARPISIGSIERCSKLSDIKNSYPKLSFKNPQNSYNSKNKLLLNSVKSKTLYDMITVLKQNFYMYSMVQYKKMGDRYYKIPNNSLDIYKEINSYSSDYVFIIFGKMPE